MREQSVCSGLKKMCPKTQSLNIHCVYDKGRKVELNDEV